MNNQREAFEVVASKKYPWLTFAKANDGSYLSTHIIDLYKGFCLTVQTQQTDSQWISVEERLPEINVPVLTSVNDGTVSAHCRVDIGDDSWGWGIPTYGDISDFRNYECDDDYFINFWMPLPPAPEGDKP